MVHGMLVAGESAHAVIVERSTPFGLLTSSEPEPFSPEEVKLEVIAPGGTAWALEPAPESAVEFLVQGDVIPGSTYLLRGRVEQSDIRASATIPSQLEVAAPAADTVLVMLGDTARLTFRARGALGVVISTTVSGAATGSRRLSDVITRAGEFELTIEEPHFASGDRITIVMLALDSVSTRYLEAGNGGGGDRIIPPSNVEGGAGVFAGATAAQRVLIVP